jgi:hypothetical protein
MRLFIALALLTVFLVGCSPAQAAIESPGQAWREIAVDSVSVSLGQGSPIPVYVEVAGSWPGLCAQLARLEQTSSPARFEINLIATVEEPVCPPDRLGLPFSMAIPLNMVEMPAGRYQVAVNGVETSFDWSK